MASITNLQDKIISLSREHLETIIPGYTHLQPAQPITFAHYLLSLFDTLKRDFDRVSEVYERVDQCPMGAGALATSSFSISRERVSALLGFSDILENSLDAVSSRDFILETLATLSIMAVNVSRFVEDFILWCTLEFRIIELPDEFSSTSSIMPQKKNPEVLEIIRARTGEVIGNLVSSLMILKALPSGYNLDLQEITPKLWDALEVLKNSLKMFSVLLPCIKVNKNLLQKSDLTFITSTELANILVKKYNVPFRTAHNIVGAVVKDLVEKNQSFLEITPEKLYETAKKIAELQLNVRIEDIRLAINPEKFVESHNVRGGPAKNEVIRMINLRKETLEHLKGQIINKKDRLKRARKDLTEIINTYLNSSFVNKNV
jgi:argininosuccinate lyase